LEHSRPASVLTKGDREARSTADQAAAANSRLLQIVKPQGVPSPLEHFGGSPPFGVSLTIATNRLGDALRSNHRIATRAAFYFFALMTHSQPLQDAAE
jgi:hypothetical protein